jgi:glutamate formiminotransferase/formiminotetrahydrofolate cyclodeaminase
VDADTKAFEGIIQARGLAKITDAEKAFRTKSLAEANLHAIEVPYRVMQVALKSMDVIEAMARDGNPNSKSDAGVGALCARSAVMGAYLNVCINAAGSETDKTISAILADGKKLQASAIEKERQILQIVGLNA